ncbi:Bacteriophage holin of superfamily 6 [anaerobic digester metagenome]
MTERTIIVDAVIKMVMLLVTAVLVPALKEWIDRNRDNKEIQLVLQMADIAVKSVENDLKTETGQKKKEEALARLACQIQGWGIKGFSTTELNHYIETAVKEMWDQELPEAVPIVIDAPDPGL